ncbi:MAG: nitroreductase family protein, partial [Bdellovibrionaceae bacterium]|nr:nitroreductase family protein [Pseudobdellovibrionaceae bacterium]
MARVANEVILKQLNWRYAVKRFDPNKKISDGDWSTIEESLRLAPSSYGLQPWRFIVVKNPKIREELRAVSWNQSQVTDCSHFVVLATRTDMEEKDVENYIAKIVSTRGASPESLEGYKKMMLGDVVHGERNKTIKWWAQRQVYIAFGMAMETA